MQKKILIIEPFFSGSHATWAKQYQKHSSHHVEILSMKGKFWKWRMYGGAVTMAALFKESTFDPDVILASDMLDVTTFLALVRKNLKADVQVMVYFHENQLTYPWQPDSEDKQKNRDLHYGFMNYTSALAADLVFFNSEYNMHSFYEEMRKLLQAMPDYAHKNAITDLYQKSSVLSIGMELQSLDQCQLTVYNEDLPLLLWNHRWEYDKNPEDFFRALFELKKEGLQFRVALLGEFYHNCPQIIKEGLDYLKDEIVVTGYMKNPEYGAWMQAADILPVTSIHEFFGISVMEAVYCGCYPILPRRLTYPELFDDQENPELFYDTFDELVQKLRDAIRHISEIRKTSFRHKAEPYDWERMIYIYDTIITS